MFAFTIPDMPWRKIAGAAIVAVLHIAIAIMFLRAMLAPKRMPVPVRETILYLQPLPQPKPKIEKIVPPSRKTVPEISIPFHNAITLPQSPDATAKALQGLGSELFDCQPENLSALSAEQRAQCENRAVKPNDSVDFADHTNRAKDAVRWAREKQRKSGPPLLPCASTQSIFATLSTATLLCLAHGGISGFDPDNAPMYGDRPEESHLPNNGDPPPIYSDPDH
jgi:hypothetical protein